MAQLVQLKKLEPEFAKLDCKLVTVFREEKDGVEGLKKAVDKTGFSPILLDTPVTATAAYQHENYATYLIDKKGVIRAVFDGTKKERPTGELLLEEAKKLFSN